MTTQINSVIIGAGQAGLATSYYLTQMNQKHIILEQGPSITPAWRSRWDSFTLVLPNWTVQMPGFTYRGEDPDGFMSRDELVTYMENYAASFEPNISFNTKVRSVEKNPTESNYYVRTETITYEAENVIIAAGTFQKPNIPIFSENLAEEFIQIHTHNYRNPESLLDGAVLVVGTGQSGCQIAEELYQSGRQVYLSVGSATRLPRTYRGKDSIWWLSEVGFFDKTVDTLPSTKNRFKANPFLSGKDGGHSLDLHKFARDGVILLGRLKDAQDKKIFLYPDLMENLIIVDKSVSDFKQEIDKFIETNKLETEEANSRTTLDDGYKAEIIEELDLISEGIRTIIWATGYKFDFSWVNLPIFDQDGYPIQDRGITTYPGLYFCGLHWLYRRKSGLLWGVGEIAANIAEDISTRS